VLAIIAEQVLGIISVHALRQLRGCEDGISLGSGQLLLNVALVEKFKIIKFGHDHGPLSTLGQAAFFEGAAVGCGGGAKARRNVDDLFRRNFFRHG
jgi:hypothetical protein